MSCSALFCSSKSKLRAAKNPKVSFHTFPKSPEVRNAWIKAINRENWEPSNYSRLCSKHFEPSCYIPGLQMKKLKLDAVPTVFEGYPKKIQTIDTPSTSSSTFDVTPENTKSASNCTAQRPNNNIIFSRDDKRSPSNGLSCITMQSHSKPNLPKKNVPKLKGIMFNLDIKKAPITQKKEQLDHAVSYENIARKILYKILLVNGKIKLVEYNGDDVSKENIGEYAENNNDYDEFVSTDNDKDNDSIKIKEEDDDHNKYKINKDTEKLVLSDSVVEKGNNETPTPRLTNKYTLQPVLNENIIQQLASIAGANLSNNKMYTTNNYLEEVKEGKDMVLLSLEKYTQLNKEQASLQYKEEKPRVEEVKSRVAKRKENNTEMKCINQELEELRKLKERLSQSFNDAQINMLKNPKKLKDINWSDEEMEKVVFLRHLISQSAYIFLKSKMHFPLPTLRAVEKWMKENNIYEDYEVQNQNADAESWQNHDDNEASIENQLTEVETATEEITMDDKQYLELLDESGSEAHNTSEPVDTEDQYAVYTDNVDHDDNTASVEEVQDLTVRPKYDFSKRCRLCTRTFDSEEEVREHVLLHYRNTDCAVYLDVKKPYFCEFCSKLANNKLDLIRHHQTHLGVNPLLCWHEGCPYVGKNRDSLVHHLYSHSARIFPCPSCGAQFKSRKGLLTHRVLCGDTLYTGRRRRASRRGPPRIKCTVSGCGEAFYSHIARRRHQHSAHPSTLQRYQCELCPATYRNKLQLNRHLHKHKTYQVRKCSKCLKVFYDYGAYYMHWLKHFGRRYTYKCPCGTRTDTEEDLELHKLQCKFVSDDTIPQRRETTKRKRKQEVEGNDTHKPKRSKTFKNVQHNDENLNENAESENQQNITDNKTLTDEVTAVVNPQLDNNQQNITTMPIVNAEKINHQPKVVTLPTNDEESSAMPSNYQRKYIVVKKNTQQIVKEVKDNEDHQTIGMQGNYEEQSVEATLSQPAIEIPEKQEEKATAEPEYHTQTALKVPKQYQKTTVYSENNQKNLIKSSEKHQKKIIVLPKNLKKNIIMLPRNREQQFFRVLKTKPQTLEVLDNRQQQYLKVPDNQQEQYVEVPDNHQEEYVEVPNNHQQQYVEVPDNHQQQYYEVPDNYQQQYAEVPDNQQQNVEILPDNHQQQYVEVLDDHQQEYVEVPDNQQHFEVPDNNQQQYVEVLDNHQQQYVEVSDINQEQSVEVSTDYQQQTVKVSANHQKQTLHLPEHQKTIIVVPKKKNKDAVVPVSSGIHQKKNIITPKTKHNIIVVPRKRKKDIVGPVDSGLQKKITITPKNKKQTVYNEQEQNNLHIPEYQNILVVPRKDTPVPANSGILQKKIIITPKNKRQTVYTEQEQNTLHIPDHQNIYVVPRKDTPVPANSRILQKKIIITPKNKQQPVYTEQEQNAFHIPDHQNVYVVPRKDTPVPANSGILQKKIIITPKNKQNALHTRHEEKKIKNRLKIVSSTGESYIMRKVITEPLEKDTIKETGKKQSNINITSVISIPSKRSLKRVIMEPRSVHKTITSQDYKPKKIIVNIHGSNNRLNISDNSEEQLVTEAGSKLQEASYSNVIETTEEDEEEMEIVEDEYGVLMQDDIAEYDVPVIDEDYVPNVEQEEIVEEELSEQNLTHNDSQPAVEQDNAANVVRTIRFMSSNNLTQALKKRSGL